MMVKSFISCHFLGNHDNFIHLLHQYFLLIWIVSLSACCTLKLNKILLNFESEVFYLLCCEKWGKLLQAFHRNIQIIF
jgi:hypothetical protein